MRRRDPLQKGFSIIEVILAVGIFMIFVSGVAGVVVMGYTSNRLSAEYTVANQFAAEGIEAVRSIKNQDFAELVNLAATGVVRTSLVWAFGGTNNTLFRNASEVFTRVIKVEAVSRDGSGAIVASGGTTDTDTKKITSTVTWNFNAARPQSIALITYLTDWKKAIQVIGNLIAVYGDTTSLAQPKYRTYSDSTNTFSTEAATGNDFTDSIVGKAFEIQTNPTKAEAIAGYVNNSGGLRIMCFDGSTWSNEWTVTVGGTGTNDHRYAIGFEKTTGDAMVVYSTNTATTNELAYRTKSGSSGCGAANWSAATTLNPSRTSGIVHWIRMENSPVTNSNMIALAWADANSDLSAMLWTGASWAIAEPTAALEVDLERVSASQDVLSFDLAFESLSGNLMVVWGLNRATTCTAGTTIATTNCIRYARYTSGWSAVAVIPTVADPATNIDIAANPNSNEFVLAALDNNQGDLSTAYWSGSAWTGRANVDTSAHCVAAGDKIVATGWLISGATTRSVIVYNDSTNSTCSNSTANIGWRVANGSAASVAQTDFVVTPNFGTPQRWYRLQSDPVNKDRLMLGVTDNSSDFFAKRLVMTATPAFTWTNADGGASLESNLGQSTSLPFSFAYWRHL